MIFELNKKEIQALVKSAKDHVSRFDSGQAVSWFSPETMLLMCRAVIQLNESAELVIDDQ